MGLNIGGQVGKVNGKELSYSDFVQRYLLKNEPVVLTGLMDDWRACKDWVLPDGRPNLPFFSTHFGSSTVQVAYCYTKEFTDQKREEMSVSEFIGDWLEFSSGEFNDGKSLLYLKDWHFVKVRIRSTWTPLHADVFRSYSWSANVCGKKKWYFLSPTQRHLVFDRNMKCSVYDIFEDVSKTKFPAFDKAIWMECTQEENEIIFVPSGWYHQVHNLEDTISINHNWFNAYNISWVWDLLLRDYNEAKEYIADIKDICDDFEELCQRNLAANTGMNFQDFFVFIVRFSFANLVLLYCLVRDNENFVELSSQRARHIYFNLESARDAALKMNSTGLAQNGGIPIDFNRNLGDSAFIELCMALGRTYQLLHEPCNISEITKALVDDLVEFEFVDPSVSHISTPEDLVSLIDYAFTKLSSLSSGKFSH
ncbi:arginine-specific demethylase JMJ20 isoform X3 [Rhododendron vialii]|uniref:arginine-specific demethylase JMJ20 isoform X3 n=1 Tax=Rhododendron vialii TaxID=182163 RepID=UPI00265F58A4|nr:arginine-specific demethylase JMJ20 isoform X3 [Rhododendron vialii]